MLPLFESRYLKPWWSFLTNLHRITFIPYSRIGSPHAATSDIAAGDTNVASTNLPWDAGTIWFQDDAIGFRYLALYIAARLSDAHTPIRLMPVAKHEFLSLYWVSVTKSYGVTCGDDGDIIEKNRATENIRREELMQAARRGEYSILSWCALTAYLTRCSITFTVRQYRILFFTMLFYISWEKWGEFY